MQVRVDLEYDDGTKGHCFVTFEPKNVHPKSFIEGMLQGKMVQMDRMLKERAVKSYVALLAPNYTEIVTSWSQEGEETHVSNT